MGSKQKKISPPQKCTQGRGLKANLNIHKILSWQFLYFLIYFDNIGQHFKWGGGGTIDRLVNIKFLFWNHLNLAP